MRVGVFHPGSQNSWQRAVAFQEAGTLAWYATSLYFPPDGMAMRFVRRFPDRSRQRFEQLLKRRSFAALDPQNMRRMGLLEPLEVALRRARFPALANRLDSIGNRHFGSLITRLAGREPVEVLWTHNGCALEAFRWAKAHGITCVLDQSVGHPRAMNAVLGAEHRRAPEFTAVTYQPYSDALIKRTDAEVALADCVVVGSHFAYETMIRNGCPRDKLRIIPYGYDETLFPDQPPVWAPVDGRPLELLFVGSIQARKGVAHLLEALRQVPPHVARLTLIGRLDVPPVTFSRYADRVRHIPQLPRSKIAAHMRAADVLVLPSLFEGGGIVLYEALAAGLAIIQSQACGDGVVADQSGIGANGIVLPEVSTAALVRAIQITAMDPNRLAGWQAASWRRRHTRSWAIYRARIRELMQELEP